MLDLEVASVPVTRFLVRSPVGSGGVTVRLVAGDPQSVVFRFFDSNGLDITEDQQRKIERLYSREDFRRVFAAEIGDIGYPPRALEQYTAALEETVDVGAVADSGFKLVVDYGFGSTSFVMPKVLAKLGRRRAGREPVRRHQRGHGVRPHDPRRAGRQPGAGLGGPDRRGASTPTASTSRSSTTRAGCSTTSPRCWPS